MRLPRKPGGVRYEADPKGLIFVDKVRLRYLGTGKPPTVVAMRVFGISSIDLPTGSSGLLTYHPNRTVVTLRTAGGSFSFGEFRSCRFQANGELMFAS